MDPVREKAQRAREAALTLQSSSNAARAAAVVAVAGALHEARETLLAANVEDVAQAEREGVARPLLSRLRLTPEKLALTLEGVRSLAQLPDPIGRTLRSTLLDDGLRLHQVSVPLGVVACVFESRPDAAIQIPALTLRSGNAVLLKGGREAERTNRAIVDAIRAGVRAAGGPEDAVGLLEGREEVARVLGLDDLVDLVVPRGSSSFVRHVMDSTRIPVLGHAEGVCHVFVDRAADPEKAARVVVDSKVDYPGACNALETLLVHRDVAKQMVPHLVDALRERGVEVRATQEALALLPDSSLAKLAQADDFGHEFGDLVLALALVDGVDEAAAFVNRHGSGHTDAIVTEDVETARRFVEAVDTAGAFVNASTRFADGYRYGLGAEVGVSTSKIHARGPVGLEGLTSTKWVLLGDGHQAAEYQGAKPRAFLHRPLDEPLDAAWGAKPSE